MTVMHMFIGKAINSSYDSSSCLVYDHLVSFKQ